MQSLFHGSDQPMFYDRQSLGRDGRELLREGLVEFPVALGFEQLLVLVRERPFEPTWGQMDGPIIDSHLVSKIDAIE